MGLWVRSQDKEILANCECFDILDEDNIYVIWGCKTSLAIYSTKEKALKVLEMLSNKIGHLENLKKTTGNLPVNFYVFQMPNDEDV